MTSRCRHPRRLWRLGSSKRMVFCGDCGARVAKVVPFAELDDLEELDGTDNEMGDAVLLAMGLA